MPDPRDNPKPGGDTQPGEREKTAPAAAEDTEIEGTPGRGENQAGFLKDPDDTGTLRDRNNG